jgi:sugar lactone lactonase YvrE
MPHPCTGFDAAIERLHLQNGSVGRILDRIDGHSPQAIDDLVFDEAYSFWFTDLGDGQHRRTYGDRLLWQGPDAQLLASVAVAASGNIIVVTQRDEQYFQRGLIFHVNFGVTRNNA